MANKTKQTKIQDVNNGEASEFESYLNSLAGTTKQSPGYAT